MPKKTRVISIVVAVLTVLSAVVTPAAATPSGVVADCGYVFTSDLYNTNLTAVEFTPGAAVVTAPNEGGSGQEFSWCVSDPIFPVGHAFTLSPWLNQSLCLDWALDDNDNAWAILSDTSCATISLLRGDGCGDNWYYLELPGTGPSWYLRATDVDTSRVAAGNIRQPWQIGV